MKTLVICSIIIGIVTAVLLTLGIPRLPKTVYLIALVQPYEQVGTGEGKILILGDSTGYGTGVHKSEESIAGLVGAEWPQYTIRNDSKNGRTIGELLEVVEGIDDDYDMVLLQIGGNDILQKRSIAEVEQELRHMIIKLKDHASHIVMLSAGNIGGASAFRGHEAEEYEQLSRDFIAMFQTVAGDYETMTYVNLFQERADDPFVQQPKTYLAIDGLHPSSAGYALWYRSLKPVLVDLLQ